MKIIKPSHHERVESYALSYADNTLPGAGYSFPCNSLGEINMWALPAPARSNLEKCERGELNVTFEGIVDYSHTYFVPSLGECECGQELMLDRFTVECDCGRLYNSSGQELAPRSQWGEYYSRENDY